MSTEIWSAVLRTVGNPDFNQYAPVSPKKTLTGATFGELKDKIEEYIGFYDVGGGNWTNPIVKRDGKRVGYLSYNGRLWETHPAKHTYMDGDTPKEVVLSR